MKRFLLFLLLYSFVFGAKAQLTHLAEIPFPAVALNRFDDLETFSIYNEDPYIIVYMNDIDWVNDKAYIYNRETGEISDFPFNIKHQFQVGDEIYYGGYYLDQQFVYQYITISDSGEPQYVADIPAVPTVEYNSKGYGLTHGDLWEYSGNAVQMKKVAAFDLPIAYPSAQFSIAEDTVYVASVRGYDIFSLNDSTYSKPYADFISSHHLELIPYSKLNGRFLYYDSSEEDDLKIYEFGAGMPPRLLPASAPLPYKMAYWNSNANSYRMHTPKGCFTSSGNITWLNIQDFTTNPVRESDVLLKVDRSETNPHIKLIRDFKRAKTDGYPGAKMIAFGDGNRMAALGLFGPEGYEPYGMIGDSLTVLKDYIPGPRGSVDEVMYSSLNDLRDSDDPVFWNGKLWFPASLPNYGREIAYSDGTAEGTGIIGDLAKGGAGLRVVRFAPSGEKMFILAQREDFTLGLYELGSDIPDFDLQVENKVNWMNEFGALPESEQFPYSDPGGARDHLIGGKDGFLYYLSRPGPMGSMLGDSSGIYGFNGEDDANWNRGNFRLKKIDTYTGDVVFSKVFRNKYVNVPIRGYQLVKDGDDLVVLGWGFPEYRDENVEITPDVGTLPQLVLTRFDTDGNFESITPIPRHTTEADVLFLSVLPSGNFLTVLKTPGAYPIYFVQEISQEGNLLFNKKIEVKYGESVYFRKDDTQEGIYLTHYNITDKNDISDALFFHYASVDGWEELGEIAYSGKMRNPDIFIKPNGERWFTGALNGKLILGDNTSNFDLTTEDNSYTIFSLRTSSEVSAYSDLTILSDVATHYFGSIVHNDEIYLQFMELDPSQPELSYRPNQTVFTFDAPFEFQFYTVQLDKNAHEATRRFQPWKVNNLWPSMYLTTIVTQDEDWYQMVAAGRENIVHVDTILPSPIYQKSMGYRLEMMSRTWDFKPTSLTVTDAQPGENGDFLNIFPNPNNGTFNILPNDGNRIPYSGYKVFDMQGRIVYNGDLPDTFNYLQLHFPSTLRAGVYQLQFEGDGVSEMHRMVLVR